MFSFLGKFTFQTTIEVTRFGKIGKLLKVKKIGK
jgi:hypothetical protein